MSRSRVKGAAGFRRLLKQLPAEARDGMVGILDDYGTKLLAEMKQDVPVATGFLRARLSKRLYRSTLRLKVGFVSKRDNGPSRAVTRATNGKRRKVNDQFVGKQFYGRIVEFGRKAQVKSVRRRKRGVNSGLRNGRKKAEEIASTYDLHIKAMAGRTFVFKKRPALRNALRASLNGYWNNVLYAAGAGAVGGDD